MLVLCQHVKSQLTAFGPANVSHGFWRAFDEDVAVFSSKVPHNDAGSSQLRDKLERFKYAQLDGILKRSGQFGVFAR